MNPWKGFFARNNVKVVWPDERKKMEKKIWFAADLHKGHTNILDFSPSRIDALGLNVDKARLKEAYRLHRESKSKVAFEFIRQTTEQMDETIVRKWNDKVGYSDDVYIIGDVSFSKKEKTSQFLSRLNGRLHLIRGNHEKETDRMDRWEWVEDYYEGTFDGIKTVMFHFPIYEWNRMHHGAFHLHGHVHGKATGIGGRILDVAMESINDVVIEWADVKRILEAKEIREHHDAERERAQTC